MFGNAWAPTVGELIRKLCSPRNFKNHVSPHEFLQAVTNASKRRFKIIEQSDPLDLLSWLLDTLHRKLKKKKRVVHDTFKGTVKISKRKLPPTDQKDLVADDDPEYQGEPLNAYGSTLRVVPEPHTVVVTKRCRCYGFLVRVARPEQESESQFLILVRAGTKSLALTLVPVVSARARERAASPFVRWPKGLGATASTATLFSGCGAVWMHLCSRSMFHRHHFSEMDWITTSSLR